jgi:hypothetical protein
MTDAELGLDALWVVKLLTPNNKYIITLDTGIVDAVPLFSSQDDEMLSWLCRKARKVWLDGNIVVGKTVFVSHPAVEELSGQFVLFEPIPEERQNWIMQIDLFDDYLTPEEGIWETGHPFG